MKKAKPYPLVLSLVLYRAIKKISKKRRCSVAVVMRAAIAHGLPKADEYLCSLHALRLPFENPRRTKRGER